MMIALSQLARRIRREFFMPRPPAAMPTHRQLWRRLLPRAPQRTASPLESTTDHRLITSTTDDDDRRVIRDSKADRVFAASQRLRLLAPPSRPTGRQGSFGLSQ